MGEDYVPYTHCVFVAQCTYRLGSCVLFCLFICFVFVCCVSSKMQRNCWWMVSLSATHRLLVADLDRDHELLHRHHVHRHEVVLESWYTHWFLIVTPVELKPQERLSLEDGVFEVGLHPLHPLNALGASVLSVWLTSAQRHA